MKQDTWVSTQAKIWKENGAGDAIEGKLIDRRENGGKYGNESYTLENDDGVFIVFGTTVLEDRMKSIAIDDLIRIVFKGIEKNKRDENIKIFEVFRKRNTSAPENALQEEGVGGVENDGIEPE